MFCLSLFYSNVLCYYFSFQGGQTALHFAAEKDHDKVVDLLLAAGAEVNKTYGVSNIYF